MKEQTFEGFAVYNQKGELMLHTIDTHPELSKGKTYTKYDVLEKKGCIIKPVTVTVKIKEDEPTA